ncbi:hypothetical protein JOD67_007286 [Tenggerimyces flavus]|nr:hypothetical protein [Tenggerimyces flavus]
MITFMITDRWRWAAVGSGAPWSHRFGQGCPRPSRLASRQPGGSDTSAGRQQVARVGAPVIMNVIVKPNRSYTQGLPS